MCDGFFDVGSDLWPNIWSISKTLTPLKKKRKKKVNHSRTRMRLTLFHFTVYVKKIRNNKKQSSSFDCYFIRAYLMKQNVKPAACPCVKRWRIASPFFVLKLNYTLPDRRRCVLPALCCHSSSSWHAHCDAQSHFIVKGPNVSHLRGSIGMKRNRKCKCMCL